MRTLFYLAVLATGLSLAAACGGGDDVTSPQPVAQPTVWTVATEPTAPPVAPAQPTAAPVVPAVAPVEPAVSPTNGVIKVTSLNRDPGGTGKGKYVFDPDEFTFNVGDVVEFTLNAETEFHTFTVDDLDIDVSLDPGSSQTMTYTFDKPGEFKLICIPHEFQGMVGSITVLP